MKSKSGLFTAAFVTVIFLANQANASFLTIDEIRYQVPPLGDAGAVQGSIDATVSGNILTLVVKNTMTQLATQSSNNLLSGLGLTLPETYMILGGTVLALDGTAANFSEGTAPNGPPGFFDISQEWGYKQPPSDLDGQGHLRLSLENQYGTYLSPYTYKLGISTLTPDIATAFAPGSIGNPQGYDGPDFGVYSTQPGMGPSSAGGVKSVGDYVTIKLTLNQNVLLGGEAAFLQSIDDNAVALLFASPNNAFIPDNLIVDTPEPASLALLGLTCLGGLGLRFRRQRSAKQADASLNA